MQVSKIEQMLDECRILRGLPEGLRHRTIFEFGGFLQDMVDFLVFDKVSEDETLAKFQKALKETQKTYDAEDFRTYADLFLKYWKQQPEETTEEYKRDLETLGKQA